MFLFETVIEIYTALIKGLDLETDEWTSFKRPCLPSPFANFLQVMLGEERLQEIKKLLKTTPQNPPKQTLQHISLFWRENRDMGTLSQPAHAPTHPQSGRSEVEWQHRINKHPASIPVPLPPHLPVLRTTFLETRVLLLAKVLSIFYGTGGVF